MGFLGFIWIGQWSILDRKWGEVKRWGEDRETTAGQNRTCVPAGILTSKWGAYWLAGELFFIVSRRQHGGYARLRVCVVSTYSLLGQDLITGLPHFGSFSGCLAYKAFHIRCWTVQCSGPAQCVRPRCCLTYWSSLASSKPQDTLWMVGQANWYLTLTKKQEGLYQ